MCTQGYTVSSGALAYYFGSDLVHRLYHVPSIGEDTVSHYADTHAECLVLAQLRPEEAVRNSHSLQYFALDVYAYDIAVPGVGCSGSTDAAASSSALATMTKSAAVAASTTVKAAASTITSAGKVSSDPASPFHNKIDY